MRATSRPSSLSRRRDDAAAPRAAPLVHRGARRVVATQPLVAHGVCRRAGRRRRCPPRDDAACAAAACVGTARRAGAGRRGRRPLRHTRRGRSLPSGTAWARQPPPPPSRRHAGHGTRSRRPPRAPVTRRPRRSPAFPCGARPSAEPRHPTSQAASTGDNLARSCCCGWPTTGRAAAWRGAPGKRPHLTGSVAMQGSQRKRKNATRQKPKLDDQLHGRCPQLAEEQNLKVHSQHAPPPKRKTRVRDDTAQ